MDFTYVCKIIGSIIKRIKIEFIQAEGPRTPNKKFTTGTVLRPYWQVRAQCWQTVLVPALAYVGDDNDVLHWSASAGPVLVIGAGIWYWCGIGICRA